MHLLTNCLTVHIKLVAVARFIKKYLKTNLGKFRIKSKFGKSYNELAIYKES